MAVMKEEYNWEYQLDRDFNFERGFSENMRVLQEERMKTWPLCRTGKNVQDAGVESTQEVDITIFSNKDPHEFQLKTMASNTLYFALRGNEEHAWLLVGQIKFGTFEKGYPLAGIMYVEVHE